MPVIFRYIITIMFNCICPACPPGQKYPQPIYTCECLKRKYCSIFKANFEYKFEEWKLLYTNLKTYIYYLK